MSSPIIPYFEPNSVNYNPEDLCVGISLEVIYVSRALETSNVLSGKVDILTGKDNLLVVLIKNLLVLKA